MFLRCLALTAWTSLILGVVACGGKPVEEKAPVIRPVRVEKALAIPDKRTRTFSGSAQAGYESKLSFRVSGTLRELSVKLGDRVSKGQVIARLDPKDYELQVQKAEAGLAQARAQERNATASYERIRGLYESNSASINDLDSARANRDSIKAQVASLEKQMELAQLQLDYSQLIVPIDGFIASVKAEVNENVRQGQEIAVLNAGSRSEINFVAPENLISQIREGDPVNVRFDALPGETFGATITEVGVATSGTATTFPVTARMNKANKDTRPGMAAEVIMSFAQEGSEPVLYVKPKAVAEDGEGRFVFVAEPSENGLGQVVRRAVSTGNLTEDGLEVKSGVADGDLVITAGLRFLKEGMTVKIPQGAEE